VEESFLKKLKRFARERTLELSIIGFIVGIITTIIGTLGVLLPSYDVEYIDKFLAKIGFWDYWLFIGAVMLLFTSVWFMYVNIKDRKTFNDLIDTGSKATFVRNQDELEEIAFRLGSKYQEILFDKKKELKIK
jgi:hypothetical protein